jgi:hypothetical protein
MRRSVWRALRVPIVDWPLAVCDATTIDPVDKVASDVIYPNYLAENRLIHYHENQAWYWVPHYTQDDILVFKATDSEDENAGKPPSMVVLHQLKNKRDPTRSVSPP